MSDNNIANRDSSHQCVAIARRALAEGDLAKAEKFAQKAMKLYSSREVASLLSSIEAVKSGGAANGQAHASSHSHAHGSNHSGHAHHTHGHEHQSSRTAGASGSASQQQPSSGTGAANRHADPGMRKRTTHAQPEKPIDENAGTPEQRKLVKSILQAKSFYEILGIEKGASDDDIKKAYRKLALKLHPDKNSAAHAEEAFKAVSKAFSCLSDPDKRAYYDRTGFENSAAASAAAAASQQRSRSHTGPAGMYYADDFDPDEIFNMFFGGGLQGQMFRAQFGGAPRRRRQASAQQTHSQEQQERHPAQGMLLGLMQVLPVLILILYSLFAGYASPSYSLVRDSRYTDPLKTDRLEIPFFVKSRHEFERSYPMRSQSRVKVERQVESAYYDRLSQRCHQERLNKQRLMYAWGTREQARKMKLESCDELEAINGRLGIRAY